MLLLCMAAVRVRVHACMHACVYVYLGGGVIMGMCVCVCMSVYIYVSFLQRLLQGCIMIMCVCVCVDIVCVWRKVLWSCVLVCACLRICVFVTETVTGMYYDHLCMCVG